MTQQARSSSPWPAVCLVAGLAFIATACAPPPPVASTPDPRAPSATASSPLSATEAAIVTTAAEPPSLVLAFVGDLMLARDVTTLLQEYGAGYALERALPLFAGADLVIGNLEGTLTDRGEPLDKTYTFRTPPELASSLTPFDAVSLANNHSTDFGATGLEDTLDTLRTAGIEAFGAGLIAEAAEAPVILDARGLRVAFLGVNDIGGVIPAGVASAGVAQAPADTADLEARIVAASRLADFVVLVMHAGTEYDRVPTERQRALAHAAIDAGADLVVGAHPHVLQPWERHEDGLVLNSLGNFVFDLDADDLVTLGSGPFETAVVLVRLRLDGPPEVMDLRPAYIDVDENRPRPATAIEARAVLEALAELDAASD